jgi:hypothetical protein
MEKLMFFLDFMSTGPGRVIRVVAGLAMMTAGVLLGGGWLALAAAGLAPLATGVLGVCPISPLVGRSWRGNACRTGRSQS